MKIGIIHSKLNGKGGSQRQALCLAYELQKMGHEVALYTLSYNKERCFSDILSHLRVVVPVGTSKKRKPIRFFHFLNYFLHAREENRAAHVLAMMIDKDTEVLNPHDRLGFRVAAYAKKQVRSFPSVLMMNDILTKRWIAWRRGQCSEKYALKLKQRIFNRVIDYYEVRKFILPHEGMVVLDHRTREWAKTYFGKDAAVVRSGLSLEEFPYVAHEISKEKAVRIFMAGIFFIHRRYEDAIRAVSLLQKRGYDVTLVIAGAYGGNQEYIDYHRDLAVLVRELGLEQYAVFTGKISDEELKKSYQTSDIYLSTNHLQSWGLAAFEAMASGCPVVVSRSTGAAEVLTDGANALMVPPRSPTAIAAALERLITNEELYASVSCEGRAFVERTMGWRLYAEGMMDRYREAVMMRQS